MTITWKEALDRQPLFINVGGKNDHGGSGRKHWPDYIAIDLKGNSDHNIRHRMPGKFGWNDGVVDRALSEHFLEHLKPKEVVEVCAEVCRVLKPNHLFRVSVPDVFHPRKRRCIDAGRDLDDRHHQSIWTYQNMSIALMQAGFARIELKQYWDEHGTFHDNGVIWELGHVKRSPKHDRRNKQGNEYGQLWSTSLIIDAYAPPRESKTATVPMDGDSPGREVIWTPLSS